MPFECGVSNAVYLWLQEHHTISCVSKGSLEKLQKDIPLMALLWLLQLQKRKIGTLREKMTVRLVAMRDEEYFNFQNNVK